MHFDNGSDDLHQSKIVWEELDARGKLEVLEPNHQKVQATRRVTNDAK